MTATDTSCIECGSSAKYKCPTCRDPFCSVACCKKHKESPCEAPPITSNNEAMAVPEINYEYPTEDTVPLEKLNLLEKSAELKKCLENPHVKAILEKLDKSPYPDELIQEYMQEPIFTEFVDECLKVVQPREDNKT